MNVVGIDVGKRKFDVALLLGDKVRSRVFDNTEAGRQGLLDWLGKQQCGPGSTHLCMEATSQYYEALALAVHAAGYTVSVVNPLQIKAFGESLLRRQKTDRADALLATGRVAAKCWRPAYPALNHSSKVVRPRPSRLKCPDANAANLLRFGANQKRFESGPYANRT